MAQKMAPGARRGWEPRRFEIRPELTEADVAWLNRQLGLLDRPLIRYARHLPVPPPVGGYRGGMDAADVPQPRPIPSGSPPPAWVTTERIRG